MPLHEAQHERSSARRVLHVAQPVEAGVAVVVRQLVQHQVDLGWHVAVACPADGALPQWLHALGVEVLPWAATRSPGPTALAEARALGRLIRTWRPDLVHLHSSKAGLAGRLVLRGRLPTVYQPHAWSFLAVEGGLARATRLWERVAARWTTAYACVSAGEQALGEEAGLRGRWFTCRNGVDLTLFRPPPAGERQAAREQHGLGEAPVALCVGRLARQKGQDDLLRAWESAPDGALLVLVGDGPDRAALERAAPPGVRFAGAQSDVAPWYAAADVVVQPSRWEAGASLALREALACGRSVVASDLPGVREVLTPDCGAVVAPEDVASLAEALRVRLRDLPLTAREGAAARALAERTLDVRTTVRDVDVMYEALLSAPRRPAPVGRR